MNSANFGAYIRTRREALKQNNASFSLRKVADRIGVEPSFLSKVERGGQSPPSEEKIKSLARELDEDPDVLLAMAGKVSIDLLEVIKQKPKLFSELIKELKELSDNEIERIINVIKSKKY